MINLSYVDAHSTIPSSGETMAPLVGVPCAHNTAYLLCNLHTILLVICIPSVPARPIHFIHFSTNTRPKWRDLPSLVHLVHHQNHLKNHMQNHLQKLDPLQIYSINLGQLPTSPILHFSLKSLVSQLEHSSLLPSLKNHDHSTISACFLLLPSFRLLLRIQIDTQAYSNYIQSKREHRNGQNCIWRSYMCLLALLYIWEYMTSLELRCIGIQISIRALYTQL